MKDVMTASSVSGAGWTCPSCGVWVTWNEPHACGGVDDTDYANDDQWSYGFIWEDPTMKRIADALERIADALESED